MCNVPHHKLIIVALIIFFYLRHGSRGLEQLINDYWQWLIIYMLKLFLVLIPQKVSCFDSHFSYPDYFTYLKFDAQNQ